MRPCTARPTHPLITCTGRAGAAATRPPPAAATTRQDAGASDHSHRARRAGPAPGPIRVDDAGMPTATMITEPERHTLAMPDDCDCGMCTPTWARRKGKSRRYTEPVTLATALQRENAAARTAMVAQHCACLAALVTAAGRVIEAEPPRRPGHPRNRTAPGAVRRRTSSSPPAKPVPQRPARRPGPSLRANHHHSHPGRRRMPIWPGRSDTNAVRTGRIVPHKITSGLSLHH